MNEVFVVLFVDDDAEVLQAGAGGGFGGIRGRFVDTNAEFIAVAGVRGDIAAAVGNGDVGALGQRDRVELFAVGGFFGKDPDVDIGVGIVAVDPVFHGESREDENHEHEQGGFDRAENRRAALT